MMYTENISPLKVLFIGNSATFVNDIPGTLVSLAQKAGYSIEANSVTVGGAMLSEHANASTNHGKNVLNEIEKGYDIVFLQDNGNCIDGDELSRASLNACDVLGNAIQAFGATVGIYFRPPYGFEKNGVTPFEQCRRFDEHFLKVSEKFDTLNVYVNRAFAFAIKDTDIKVWGDDNAHTSVSSAYLAVCVFFATIFNTSSKILDTNGVPSDVALTFQEIADKVVFGKAIPW